MIGIQQTAQLDTRPGGWREYTVIAPGIPRGKVVFKHRRSDGLATLLRRAAAACSHLKQPGPIDWFDTLPKTKSDT